MQLERTERERTGYDPEYERLVEEESLILEATERITEVMDAEGISKAELARRLDKSRAYVTQVLDGSRNMTLRTLSDLAFALGYRIRIEREPIPELAQGSLSHGPSKVVQFHQHPAVLSAYRRFQRGHSNHAEFVDDDEGLAAESEGLYELVL